jgi:hypothetical protein
MQKKMKTYPTIALVLIVAGFGAAIAVIEMPRDSKPKEKAYVLPLVEDMEKVANPLQF